MNLIKHPFNSFLSLENTFNNLLRQDTEWFTKDRWLPETDVVETDNEIKLQMECPGISPEDLKVKLESNVLTVSGEKRNQSEVKEGNYHKLERSYGSFTRSFTLPAPIEQESITAEYKDGVISITATKSEDSKAKMIEVKTSEETKPKALSASG